MTAEALSAVFGVLLSLAFSYIPGLKAKFDEQPADTKQAIMGVGIVLVGSIAFALACGNIITGIECTRDGALAWLSTVIAALVANQSIYQLTKKVGD